MQNCEDREECVFFLAYLNEEETVYDKFLYPPPLSLSDKRDKIKDRKAGAIKVFRKNTRIHPRYCDNESKNLLKQGTPYL
jgi:hypothetical protein